MNMNPLFEKMRAEKLGAKGPFKSLSLSLMAEERSGGFILREWRLDTAEEGEVFINAVELGELLKMAAACQQGRAAKLCYIPPSEQDANHEAGGASAQ